jgi:ABC-type nitrate/sulfonate/bicarbonate transport system ATPase subunit
LELSWDEACRLTFVLRRGRRLRFTSGFYYLVGDNGSGKTSFLNLMSLTAGTLGPTGPESRGTVSFNGTAYNDRGFDAVKAAKIRQRYYGIFPQKVFFLPVSSRDNYRILNGRDPAITRRFSKSELPDRLSGGQQQERLMEIVLDDEKPIWFLDEPLTHLDAERRLVFWRKLEKALQKGLQTVLMVDHWIAEAIRGLPELERVNTLRMYMESRRSRQPSQVVFRTIDIYRMAHPLAFVRHQIRGAATEEKAQRKPNPLALNGSWLPDDRP